MYSRYNIPKYRSAVFILGFLTGFTGSVFFGTKTAADLEPLIWKDSKSFSFGMPRRKIPLCIQEGNLLSGFGLRGSAFCRFTCLLRFLELWCLYFGNFPISYWPGPRFLQLSSVSTRPIILPKDIATECFGVTGLAAAKFMLAVSLFILKHSFLEVYLLKVTPSEVLMPSEFASSIATLI